MPKGRPPTTTNKQYSNLTIRLPTPQKQKLINMAHAYDLTITEYIQLLIDRDSA